MKNVNNQFYRREVDDLKSRQNEAMNDLQLSWNSLKTNIQRLFLIIGKTFYFF